MQKSIIERPARKIARAEFHFAEALNRMESWARDNPVSAQTVVSEDRKRIDAVLAVATEPPLEDVSLAIGDAIHNLRSALDGMTWNLAHLNGAPDRPRDIQFPVTNTGKQWRDAAKKLSSLPPETLARMLEMQPKSMESPSFSFVGILHDLDIRDKHHDFLRTHGQVQGIELNATIGVDADTVMGPIEAFPRMPKIHGTRLASLPFSKPIWEGVDAGGRVQFAISFEVEVYADVLSLELSQMAATFPAMTTAVMDEICRGL